MSFLYPLFLAGIATVSLPIILHMIRRQTRKRVVFSSLMFLRTTVPKFKNRSRIENLLLLILRCIILVLLAFAFSRPFFPQEQPGKRVSPARRIVILIDTSASMRRTGMWAQAVSKAQSALKDIDNTDRLSVMSFDQGARTLIGFEQWGQMDSARRHEAAAGQISNLSPGWAATNLGDALVTAAEAIEDDEVNDEQQKFETNRIVLISDLQKGSNLEALQAYEWPETLELDVKMIGSQGPTNAAMQLITNRDLLTRKAVEEQPSIRITNSPDAAVERFVLSWADEKSVETSDSKKEVYVPAGHSVIAQVPKRTDYSAPGKLVLTGDDHDFDNALYIAPRFTHRINILFVGNAIAGDPKDMLYYLKRAFRTTSAIDPVVFSRSVDNLTDTDIQTAHLIIVVDTIGPKHIDSLLRYLETGRTVLLVIKSQDTAETIAQLAGIENVESQEADVDSYTMLSRIDYKHPLLVPFSEPRFGDFTRIHFWKYRRLNVDDIPSAKVLARFDSNDPALFELRVSKGSLLVLSSGWHPSDSQLALSSKFVPLLYSILEYGGIFANRRSQYFVGDNISLSTLNESMDLEIHKPDGSVVRQDAEKKNYTQTDLPGIYTIGSSAGDRIFALNIPASECRTAVMPVEDIEMLGVSLSRSSHYSVDNSGLAIGLLGTSSKINRKLASVESEQKFWRLILIVLLAFSFVEIAMAGWLTRSPVKMEGEKT